MKIYYLLLLFLMTACSSTTEGTSATENEHNSDEIAEPVRDIKKEVEKPVSNPDSVLVPSFTVHFDFSEKVQEILDSKKERLVINLVLSGMPLDAAKLMDKDYYSDEDQQVYLKNIEILYEQNDAQSITIENLKISEEALNALEHSNYTVGLNFYSSRTSSDNNIFSADALIEEVDAIKGKIHSVKVSLL